MADFVGNQAVEGGVWTDVTGGFAGSGVAVQNRTSRDMFVFFGNTEPTDTSGSIRLPASNWPLLQGTINTKLWVFSRVSGQVHVSELS